MIRYGIFEWLVALVWVVGFFLLPKFISIRRRARWGVILSVLGWGGLVLGIYLFSVEFGGAEMLALVWMVVFAAGGLIGSLFLATRVADALKSRLGQSWRRK